MFGFVRGVLSKIHLFIFRQGILEVLFLIYVQVAFACMNHSLLSNFVEGRYRDSSGDTFFGGEGWVVD